jgi:multiple sugar transport system permease protein
MATVNMHTLKRTMIYSALVVLSVWILFPFYWIFLTSIKTPVDVIAAPPKFSFKPTIENYVALFFRQQESGYASSRPDFLLYFRNSAILASGAVLISVAAGVPAAYILARYSFRGKDSLAFTFLSFRFAPALAVIIPLNVIFQRIGLYNTHIGLILAYQVISLPLMIWIMRGYFQEIPKEIEEAALIDGCSWWGTFIRVATPLAVPGLAATSVLAFIFCWNNFTFALILGSRETFPITVGAIQFISYESVLWGQMAGASLISIVPQLIAAIFIQKYIVRGLTMGAVK